MDIISIFIAPVAANFIIIRFPSNKSIKNMSEIV